MSTVDEARAAMKARRRARHLRRTAPAAAAKTRASDIAPRRIGDGLQPNHAARAVDIDALFPKAPKLEPIRTDGHITGYREVSS